MIENLISSIKVFRDDLYPFLGGGNKGRKMLEIAKDIYEKKANALVTTGGIQSNHCRAVAIFASQNQIECTLVLHGSKSEFENQSGNAKVMRMSGAKIIFVNDSSEISTKMDEAMLKYNATGLNPYYIWGGGHTMEGGKAYIDVLVEVKKYSDKNNWEPKYIFLASGTGSTQAGIMAGLDKYNFFNTTVIGISVARKSEPATKVVKEFYENLCNYFDIKNTQRETIVLDDYLFGGYSKYSKELKLFSENSIKNFGMILDTCYSAKAFYGMLDYIRKNNINTKDILFWHTGGVFNFLAE